jgi:4-oxalocrotonate tautomerase
VKLWPGKSEQQKERLAEKIAKDVMDVLSYGEESVSVGLEEISPKDWKEKVYKPDIKDKWDKLYKKPITNRHVRGKRTADPTFGPWAKSRLAYSARGLASFASYSRALFGQNEIVARCLRDLAKLGKDCGTSIEVKRK